ncbi:serine hydrolase domain-containing protein [Herbiconiux moechotypicola]|uniref:Serine hydrolase domain-containing protein n=2 Tax=Herbiconiux moechotypicola TaxID=637393 RepID=A0ABN3E576_9MICO
MGALAVIAAGGLLLAGCSAGGGTTTSTAAPAGVSDEAAAVPEPTRPAAPEGELPAELQSELQSTLESTMAEYSVPGAAVGVWIPGVGSWTTASGLADIAGNVPVTTEMSWPLRSVTKSYTVTLILQLVDEGKLSLDDTIDQYVEGVTDGDRITIRQLADMSSGNADYTNDAFLADFSQDTTKIYTIDELNGFMLGLPAQFEPGTAKVYTNANTNLLGAVIEKVTGADYDQVLQERILDPLGQTGTHYIVDVADWTGPHPTGYQPGATGPEAQDQNPSILGAAGAMFSTLDDSRVWADTLGDGTLLTPETQAERQEGAPLDAGPPYDRYALGMGETAGWWGHNGEGVGFTAAVFHQSESGASIVVFMNESDVDDAHPADQTFRRLAEVLTAQGVL